MLRTALITGIGGFVGKYLAIHLVENGFRVVGLDRHDTFHDQALPLYDHLNKMNADHRNLLKKIPVYQNDLSDPRQLATLMDTERVDDIYHLAGMAFVPDAWADPAGAITSNVNPTLNLLQGCRLTERPVRFLLISTSSVYGTPREKDLPLTEDSPINPGNPYAESKWIAEKFSSYYNSDTIKILIARPFNHTGPGQTARFVVPAFFHRIQESMEKGEDHIQVGDLRSGRDFSDVRDVVSAYRLIMMFGDAGIPYNVCSGQMVTIEKIFQMALKIVGTSISYKVDETLLRPEPPNFQYGSAGKVQDLGWLPEITLEQSMSDIWQFLLHNR